MKSLPSQVLMMWFPLMIKPRPLERLISMLTALLLDYHVVVKDSFWCMLAGENLKETCTTNAKCECLPFLLYFLSTVVITIIFCSSCFYFTRVILDADWLMLFSLYLFNTCNVWQSHGVLNLGMFLDKGTTFSFSFSFSLKITRKQI